jgi:nucleotide-binding universal stress UspA family protein
MKTILLPLLDDDSEDSETMANAAIGTAHLLASRFGSHVEGLFVKAEPMSGMTAFDVAPSYFERHHAYWHESGEVVKRRFTNFMTSRKVPFCALGESAGGPTAEWREETGDRIRVVGDYGRLFDLIVIGRTSSPATERWVPVCEAALFESGRPVVVAPPKSSRTIGRNVLLAWNGSTETARTIGLGMPLLLGAESVTVLSVTGASGGMVAGPDGEKVAAHLARNGIKAAAKTLKARGRSAGEAILDEAAAVGADLIVKGAYTHSRLREVIFGGTTRHILAAAPIPVLIAH